MSYINEQLKLIESRNQSEPEFLQAVKEVLTSVEPIFESNPKYKTEKIIERIVEPDRQIKFKVTWIDDNGNFNVNRGYRVQFSNAIGPYKGGLRFHPSVNISIMKFLAFEQVFKNALTSLPIGGAKGGSDFDPKGKSDREILSFCKSFMTELYRHIGKDVDVPAGDIGVGNREIGYLFGQYKKIRNSFEGAITGKDLKFGGSCCRTEATGYGLLYITEEMLKDNFIDIANKTVCISGSGNVAIYAAEKAVNMGCKVLTMSDSDGYIFDKDGVDVEVIKNIKEANRGRICDYLKYKPDSEYFKGKFGWNIKCDIALPCATQNEIDIECAKNLVTNGVIAVAEGANMPSTLEAAKYFIDKNVLYLPGKAANAGGVAVSAFEMSQDSMGMYWSRSEVDEKLKRIMKNIFNNISNTAKTYGLKGNYLSGANIAGFTKVADAMLSQGI